ncbi:glutathione hydrolase 1 proenzyme [Misgurnus anguillicaudatus]|uniref:glutathione hydrolase 1 proenzyme n=1 Tax=Misgurnus anguillicaudatus TaxID=75329 RepID=UPI003CCF07BD
MDPHEGRIFRYKTSQYTISCQWNLTRCLLFFTAVTVIVVMVKKLNVKPTVKPNEKCYPHVAVAADAGRCSEVGRDILKEKNGSAVDAAIATLLCVGLFNPHSMGIGGGVVFTIYNASTGRVEVIDARETAPMKASADMFDKDPQKAETGGLSIGVPGLIRGFEMAHNRHGRLKWSELFEPSIKLAREGVKIGRALGEAIKENNVSILNDTIWCEVFCKSNNTLWKENDTIHFLKLADTYETISKHGPNAFYNGSLTQNIVKDIQAAGGIITSEDLQGYKARLNEYALNFTVRNYTFHVPTAPFGGPVLAMILKIVNGYNISSSSMRTNESMILTYHRIIESFRFAYAHKSKLGDPQYVNVTDFIQEMISDKFADYIRSKINDNTTKPDDFYEHDTSPSDDNGTSHLSIIAEDGSAVAVTSSINDRFGSMVMSNLTGIIFNDQMSDFSFNKTGKKINQNNLIEPGKRPLSSMCPTIIMDNSNPKHKRVKMLIGASGGTKITTATALVILNYLFFDYGLKKAVDQPRVHNGWEPNVTFVEDKFNKFVIDGLKQKNHTIQNIGPLGKVQAAVRQADQICAECDYRKGGYPAGY